MLILSSQKSDKKEERKAHDSRTRKKQKERKKTTALQKSIFSSIWLEQIRLQYNNQDDDDAEKHRHVNKPC